ncbi:MAG: SufD family Fe-S cluster assembly protein [Candidatus Micrarchaeaceae archaeon]
MPDKREDIVSNEDYAERYGFSDKLEYSYKTPKGISEAIVREISGIKGEPDWMLEKRLLGYKIFKEKPLPRWGADLSGIDFSEIYYYLRPTERHSSSWEDVPAEIKKTFEKLGVPEAERKFFAGTEAQYDSEAVYSHIKKELESKGVIFTDTDSAVKEYPELVRRYFGTIIPPSDNKFAALNTAVWSGGSFIYVPKGVKLAMPLQAYFRINAEKAGQFERTLIIADEGADVTYIEGCFLKGTKIKTLSGTKPIEEVNAGDYVLTHRGQYKMVYHTQVRKHNGKVFHIKYMGDTTATLNVTGEHPFLISKRERKGHRNTKWDVKWVRADELEKGDYLAIPIDRNIESKERREFYITTSARWRNLTAKISIATDKEFFRLIGYYLSEGSTTGKSNKNYLSFTFNKNETEYIGDTVLLLKKYFGKEPIVQAEYKNGISIVLCDTMAAEFFSTEFGNGAANKHLPNWVMHESLEKQKELIKGMWRGDGSYMNKKYNYGIKKMFRINTISIRLAEQMREMMLRFNIFASINKQKRSDKRHVMYCIYVGGENLLWFANLMGVLDTTIKTSNRDGTMSLVSIKQAQTQSSHGRIYGDYAFVPITEISSEEASNVDVYNFSVEEDESYVAEGVAVHNCTAPIYMSSSLHAAVVELVAHKDAHIRYVTVQNWSKNVYNLVTQRAHAYENANVEWIDFHIGSRTNMIYPSIFLKGRGASGSVLSVAIAGKGQVQDTGGKIYHLAPETSSKIVSKSVSAYDGLTTYRGLIYVGSKAENVKSAVRCDALLLHEGSKANTFPDIENHRDDATLTHEATVGRIGEEQLFYLMSRGLSEEDAITSIVMGFLEPLAKELPLEYSIELKRLIELDTTGSVG